MTADISVNLVVSPSDFGIQDLWAALVVDIQNMPSQSKYPNMGQHITSYHELQDACTT